MSSMSGSPEVDTAHRRSAILILDGSSPVDVAFRAEKSRHQATFVGNLDARDGIDSKSQRLTVARATESATPDPAGRH